MISKLKSPKVALIVIGAALFLYIVLRAFLVSFTHDEGLTVMEYATQPWATINDLNWTNNHLLNTWLCRLNLDWFGASEISFRWPNVFAGLLYIVFAGKLVRRIFADSWFGVFTFVILLCNTFLIDFFSLARGYGLSMGLFMTGLYYFYRYFETRQFWQYGIALTAFGLALVANYTLLNFFLLQAGFFLLHAGSSFFYVKMSWKEKALKFILYVFYGIMTYFFTAWFIKLMLNLREVGNFNFGGEDGFWQNTVQSLIEFSNNTLVNRIHGLLLILTVMALLLYVFSAGIIFLKLRKEKFTPLNWFTVFLFLVLSGCGAAIWLQHLIMQVPFSTDRAGLYFYVLFPLLITTCFFTPGTFSRNKKINFSHNKKIVAGAFFIIPVISFLTSLNLDRTILWPFNAHTREEVEALINDSKNQLGEKDHLQVTVTFLQHPVYNFYLYKEKAPWLNFVVSDETGFNYSADYFMRLDDLEGAPQGNYKIVWQGDGKTLYRKDPLLKCVELRTLNTVNFEDKSSGRKAQGFSGLADMINDQDAFSTGISDTIRETIRAGTLIHCHAKIWADKIFTSTKFVIDITPQIESARVWRGYYINWQLHEEKKWSDYDFWYMLGNDLAPGDVVFMYFLNIEKTEVRIDDFSVQYHASVPK